MKKTLLFVLLATVGLTACSEAEKPQENMPSMANPASEFCVEQGGEVVMKNEDGDQVGYCKLSDGRLIEEWTFMNEHNGDKVEQPIGMANPSAVFCEEQGGTYINKDGENGQVGFCKLADGTEVEAWEYFRANSEGSQAVSREVLIGMANPASVFCEEQGGVSIIKDEADGQVGYCQLADGTEVEEWEFFNKHHVDAEQPMRGMADPSAVFCEEQGGEYLIGENADGQFGQCKLLDGTLVDSWEYYRAEHQDDTKK